MVRKALCPVWTQLARRSHTLAIQPCEVGRFGHLANHAHVISKIRSQSANFHPLSNFFIVDALRSSYPDHVLVQIKESTGVIPYIRAGELTASLDRNIEYYASREKNHSESVGADKIILKDEVDFGRYNCSWKGRSFYIYAASWTLNEWEIISNHYILCAKHDPWDARDQHKFIDDLITAALKYNTEVEEEIWVYQNSYWHRSKSLWNSIRGSSWDQVILDQETKAELMTDVSRFFDRKEYYTSFGVPWKRGLILHGLPGNGKTVTIKAMMRMLNQRQEPIPSLYVKSITGGASASDISDIFSKARETAPCLLVCEDLDGLITESVRSLFLNEIDGLEHNDGILIVGSTNYYQLDVAISKRPSRFDRKYHFPLPAISERTRYCDYWLQKLSKNASLELSQDISHRVAAITESFSFAYLQEIFVSAMVSIISDIAESGNSTSPGPGAMPTASSDKVWQSISKQVERVKKELLDSKKSVEDANRNTAVGDATSGSAKRTGFGS